MNLRDKMKRERVRMHYCCYGLNIKSEIQLPFVETGAEMSADLEIQFGKIEADKEKLKPLGLGIYYDSHIILLTLQGIARYYITEKKIIIEPAAESDHASVINFLIGAAIPYCIVLRNNNLVFRGCAFTMDGETANLIIGHSGSGKSALVSSLCQQNAKLLSDEFSVISFDGNAQPCVESAFPRVKLWPDMIHKLSLSEEATTHFRMQSERKIWTIPDSFFHAKKLPVKKIFILKDQNLKVSSLLEPIRGAKKIARITQHQFGQPLFNHMGMSKKQIQLRIRLIAAVSIATLIRVNSHTTLDELKAEVIA